MISPDGFEGLCRQPGGHCGRRVGRGAVADTGAAAAARAASACDRIRAAGDGARATRGDVVTLLTVASKPARTASRIRAGGAAAAAAAAAAGAVVYAADPARLAGAVGTGRAAAAGTTALRIVRAAAIASARPGAIDDRSAGA